MKTEPLTIPEMLDRTITRVVERHFQPAEPPPPDNDNQPKDAA